MKYKIVFISLSIIIGLLLTSTVSLELQLKHERSLYDQKQSELQQLYSQYNNLNNQYGDLVYYYNQIEYKLQQDYRNLQYNYVDLQNNQTQLKNQITQLYYNIVQLENQIVQLQQQLYKNSYSLIYGSVTVNAGYPISISFILLNETYSNVISGPYNANPTMPYQIIIPSNMKYSVSIQYYSLNGNGLICTPNSLLPTNNKIIQNFSCV